MDDVVLVEHRDGAAISTITRPEARKAVDWAVSDAATKAIDELDERHGPPSDDAGRIGR